MARYHVTVESRRPATETFGYLATFSKAAEWDPGVLAGEQLDPGPAGAGSRFRLVVPFLGGHPRGSRASARSCGRSCSHPRAGRRHDRLAGHRAAVSLGSSRFWHDRRARPERPLPWTRETDPSTARKSGTTWPRRPARTHAKLAQAGRDSVAADRSSLRGGRDDRAAAGESRA